MAGIILIVAPALGALAFQLVERTPARDQLRFVAEAEGAETIPLLNVTRDGSGLVITFEAAEATTYRLERKPDITDAMWQSIPGVSDLTAASSGPAQLSDPAAFEDERGFYRVRYITSPIFVSIDDPAAVDDAGCGLGPAGSGAGRYPCRTIGVGLTRAATGARSEVRVADGVYDEAVTLVNGISLLGGFRPDTWERHVATTNTIIQGVSSSGNHDRTVIATGINAATVFEGFIVRGALNSKPGGNSYAVQVVNSTGSLAIRSNQIQAGRGGPGLAGSAGSTASPGVNGTGRKSDPSGYDAFTATGTGACNTINNRQHANGGARTCGADNISGGHGGGNRCPVSSTLTEFSGLDGAAGQPGVGALGGAGGAGGDAGDDMRLENNGTTCAQPPNSPNGQEGEAGQSGTNAAAVSGCSNAGGIVIGGHWLGGSGSAGLNGGNGGGGGGGGAGGGAFCVSCPGSKDRLGGHGGGGGSGGCGGGGGSAGLSGGGAFGIFIVGGTAPVVTGNVITRGDGGTGGHGGNGATGAQGGTGGNGGSGSLFCTGNGGRGGDGGAGGHGSGGGGACGGSSFGIYTSGVGTPNYCLPAAGNVISGGSAGAGGAGGLSVGNPGANGANGLLATCSFQ